MIYRNIYKFLSILLAIALFVPILSTAQTSESQEIRPIIFPILGQASYGRSFGDPRSGGRTHEGVDIFAGKGTPVVAAVDGTIRSVVWPQASWGYSVTIRDDDGYTYHYLHLNNDTPGTDDGIGLGEHAYALGMKRGNKVIKGQILGYVGDSGNAETTPSHLHFEIRKPSSRDPIDPYASLAAAPKIQTPAERPFLENEIVPYGLNFSSGVSVDVSKETENHENILVTGTGRGGGPHVRIFNEDKAPLFEFMAYDPNFFGGVNVAMGDVDGDGITEIITSPGPGGGPHVRVFSLAGYELFGFMAYDPGFSGGVNIASADINSDGKAEIITAPMSGGGPHVRIFNSSARVLDEFMAYDPGFFGGIDVSASNESFHSTSTDGVIVTAPGSGGGPHVKIFNGNGVEENGFMAYDGEFRGGVKVALGDLLDASGLEIITIPESFGGPHMRSFSLNGKSSANGFPFEEWWLGGYDIAATDDFSVVSSGTRRRNSVLLNPHEDLSRVREPDEWEDIFEESNPN